MGVHPLALKHGLTREQIDHTVEQAAATIAIDNGPTLILILGHDADKHLVEATGVIRDEDVLFVHAALARPGYQKLLDTAQALPGAADPGPSAEDDGQYGWSVDGLELTDALISDLAQRARTGHSVDTLKIRLRPGRPAPLSIGHIVRLELKAPLYSACAERADANGVPVHEVIRRALREHLQNESAHHGRS